MFLVPYLFLYHELQLLKFLAFSNNERLNLLSMSDFVEKLKGCFFLRSAYGRCLCRNDAGNQKYF